MPIQIALKHITAYRYDRPIHLGPQIIRLRPAAHARTPILSYSLKINPAKHFMHWQQDPQGNYLARLTFPEKTDVFEIEVNLTAEMIVINPFDFFLEEHAQQYPFCYDPSLEKELKPFLEKENQGDVFNTYVATIGRDKKPTIPFLVDLIQHLNKEIKYLVRLEAGIQTPRETLIKASGSCRDTAWLLVNVLRHLGLAARFVSGYLIQLKPDVKALDGPLGAQEDFTDLHAWVEVYLPAAGWVGLDATSGLLAGEGHIPLVATSQPSLAAPVSGGIETCKVVFSHQMQLTRCYEDPRVTKPYTDDQWKAIDALGQKIDEEIKDLDLRLTMGSEPTFVSMDDRESDAWHLTALGEGKRALAENLLRRLKQEWTKGALLYAGQGKWYPGEQLPRWVLGCYWRKDGKPIWRDEALLADATKEYAYTLKEAKSFIQELCVHLGVNSEHILSGYEDTFYYLWQEKRLPFNVNPRASVLKDELERARLTRIFEEQLGEIIGFALPLKSNVLDKTVVWQSGRWQFRSLKMFLIPGDSPMGLRLPLDALPWEKLEDQQQIYERDPLEFVEDLTEPVLVKECQQSQACGDVVRTALCVEARCGCIYVFLPPLGTAEEYLDLIARVETTAAQLKMPVVIEGYPPAYDVRIESFQVTPDPGVIEVNVAPVASWSELVAQVEVLYAQARQSRLSAEKFMLDGKHIGTGGGNHLVLGGKTPADSPFLRRPDLLASMVAYWNNHPSLSYLFSGQFIGPTSQAPRVDEGRKDSIYELEIALQQMHAQIQSFGQCPPWMVDRLFRHLLVDQTGNTHRAEFCIDKMYSPDSARGRLGLVELRAFEMPPDPKMNLTQQLLIRTLLVGFWKTPFKERLLRWDTSLHDRFLLEHFIKEDFLDIINDLNKAGYALKSDYFAAHFEFRFPKIGEVSFRGVHLELRTAIEPWYVLGEEPAGGGTSRFVDASVERMQIKVQGLAQGRYRVLCNDRPLPLHSTGVEGEYVAGIRYRAWQPVACLHPTLPVNLPLVFDLLDTWNQCSIGGCVYHGTHPGGRNYEILPLNAFEAEARREARFSKIGQIKGVAKVLAVDELNRDFPLTLDLRRKI